MHRFRGLKFIPLEFETNLKNAKIIAERLLKFIPLEFETLL